MGRLRDVGVASALLLAALAPGCSDPWARYEGSLYEALRVPGRETYEQHAALLGEVVAHSREEGRTPPPGVQAEYALYLARTGRPDEAKRLLRAEVASYPESAQFVEALERVLEGHRAFRPREEP